MPQGGACDTVGGTEYVSRGVRGDGRRESERGGKRGRGEETITPPALPPFIPLSFSKKSTLEDPRLRVQNPPLGGPGLKESTPEGPGLKVWRGVGALQIPIFAQVRKFREFCEFY